MVTLSEHAIIGSPQYELKQALKSEGSLERVIKDTSIQAAARCPVCSHPSSPQDHQCPRCSALYHNDCWEYNKHCGIFGCEPEYQPPSQNNKGIWGVFEPSITVSRSLQELIADIGKGVAGSLVAVALSGPIATTYLLPDRVRNWIYDKIGLTRGDAERAVTLAHTWYGFTGCLTALAGLIPFGVGIPSAFLLANGVRRIRQEDRDLVRRGTIRVEKDHFVVTPPVLKYDIAQTLPEKPCYAELEQASISE